MPPRLKIGTAATIRERDLFSTHAAPASGGLVRVIMPQRPQLALDKIVGTYRDDLVNQLHRHGALLFRGWDVSSTDDLNSIVTALSENVLDYSHKSTPRTRIRGGIYTSTEYPPDQVIPLHNELSWSATAPRYLWFCCLQPPGQDGATPIADTRKVLRLIPRAVRDKFARDGILYVRNYHPNVDLPWQEVFGTENRREVEAYCQAQDMQAEWVTSDQLRTYHRLHAVIRHPETGELSWFNQAHLFHFSRVGSQGAASLMSMFGKDNLPRNTYLGTGEDISDEELASIRAAYDAAAYRFPWEAGDVLLVDNLVCAHGRETYVPPRRVVVAMTDPIACASISSTDAS